MRKKEKWTNKEDKHTRMLNLSYTIQVVITMFVPNFKNLGAAVPEKSLTQISLCITLK